MPYAAITPYDVDGKGRQSLFLVQDVTNVLRTYTHISLERDEEREKKRETERKRRVPFGFRERIVPRGVYPLSQCATN